MLYCVQKWLKKMSCRLKFLNIKFKSTRCSTKFHKGNLKLQKEVLTTKLTDPQLSDGLSQELLPKEVLK